MRIPAAVRTLRGRTWGTPTGIALLLVVVVLLLRAPFLFLGPYADEGGLLIVARHWAEGIAGPYLYGDLFVDRPPLLLLVYRLADALGGLPASRVFGELAAAVTVGAACWIGHRLAGRRGLVWSGVVAAALVCHPALGTSEVNAELLGAPLTMLALCALVTLDRRPERLWPAFVAGLLGGCALLVKQNILDALVLGVVLALTAALTRSWPWRRALAVTGLGVAGALVPVAAAVAWAATGPGVGVLWQTVYGFRIDSARVLADQSTLAPRARLVTLGEVALISGMLALLLASLWPLRRRIRAAEPLVVATLAMIGVEVLGVLGGASFWTHYLIGVIPGLTLLVALVAESAAPLPVMRALVALTAMSSLVGILWTAPPWGHRPSPLADVAAWLHDARRPGDTAFVAYGQAQVLYAAGLEPGYPQLWSLPLRTLDPRFDGVVRTLDGSHAPTWFVSALWLGSWGIDTTGRVQTAVDDHYRLVGAVCGIGIYLHDGDVRRLPPLPTPSC